MLLAGFVLALFVVGGLALIEPLYWNPERAAALSSQLLTTQSPAWERSAETSQAVAGYDAGLGTTADAS